MSMKPDLSLRISHSFFQQYVKRLNSHVYFRPRKKEKFMSLSDIKYTIRRGIEIENERIHTCRSEGACQRV